MKMTEKHKPPYQFALFGAELGLGTTCWIESVQELFNRLRKLSTIEICDKS